MATYLSLLSKLRSYKSTATASRKKYKSRRSAVNSILKDLQNDFDNNVEAVKKKQATLIEESASGFYNLSNIVSQNSEIAAIVELDPDVDKNLAGAMESLNSEIAMLDAKIENLDGIITELNRCISQVTAAMLSGADVTVSYRTSLSSDIQFRCNW